MAPKVALPYRLLFLYFEPFMAFTGAIICLFNPTLFLNGMSPTAVYAPSNQVIFDQLAGTYTLFAFNEAVVLRVTNDIRVWKAILVGILICDMIHLYASYTALGATVFWDPRLWRLEDTINLGTLWGQSVVRIAFLLNIGLDKNGKQKRK